MLEKIKGAIFDMDGTLIDSLMLWNIICNKLGERYLNCEKFRLAPEDAKAIMTMTLKQAMELLHSVYEIGDNPQELIEAANEIIRDFYANEVQLKDGVLELLEHCYKNNIKMCLASATDLDLMKVAVNHCNIEKYFIKIISCSQIGKGKDQPDIYIKALEVLETPIDETCVFEDSYTAIATADKLGMKTVGIYDKYNDYGRVDMKKIVDVYIDEGETLKKLLVAQKNCAI